MFRQPQSSICSHVWRTYYVAGSAQSPWRAWSYLVLTRKPHFIDFLKWGQKSYIPSPRSSTSLVQELEIKPKPCAFVKVANTVLTLSHGVWAMNLCCVMPRKWPQHQGEHPIKVNAQCCGASQEEDWLYPGNAGSQAAGFTRGNNIWPTIRG